MANRRPKQNEKAPRTGEQTKAQAGRFNSLGASGAGGITPFIPSYSSAPAGTIETYRRMRANPTIAIGRMAGQSPVKAANWSVEAKDDAPEGAVELIQDAILPLRAILLNEALRARDYGFQPMEVIWDNVKGRLVPRKFKPLLPELTNPVVHRETGAYMGLKQGRVELPPQNTIWITYDMEAGNLFGRSIFENIRENAWWPWMELLRREGQFTSKVAGATVAIGYVPGTGQDENGDDVDNFKLAQNAGSAFGRGDYVLYPKTLVPWAEDLLNRGVDPDKLMAWSIDYMEPSSGHGEAFVTQMRHKESLMLRGLLVPERMVTEGQYGTKAEAEAHADIALDYAEEQHGEIARAINWYVVDRVLRFNYGPEAVGKVYITPEPVLGERRRMVREILTQVLTQPANVDLLLAVTDLDAMLDQAGLPKSAEVVKNPVLNREEIGDNGGDNPEGDGDDVDGLEASVRSRYASLRKAIELGGN